MATEFDSLFGSVGFPVLLELHGEWVVYESTPGKASGDRRIRAIVDRNPPTSWDAAENVSLPEVVVRFHNHPRLGVRSESIDTGVHRIRVSRVNGKPEKSLAIEVLTEDSGGVCVVGLR
jgi:hypothetical protein